LYQKMYHNHQAPPFWIHLISLWAYDSIFDLKAYSKILALLGWVSQNQCVNVWDLKSRCRPMMPTALDIEEGHTERL